jgi:hypothetical protein
MPRREIAFLLLIVEILMLSWKSALVGVLSCTLFFVGCAKKPTSNLPPPDTRLQPPDVKMKKGKNMERENPKAPPPPEMPPIPGQRKR